MNNTKHNTGIATLTSLRRDYEAATYQHIYVGHMHGEHMIRYEGVRHIVQAAATEDRSNTPLDNLAAAQSATDALLVAINAAGRLLRCRAIGCNYDHYLRYAVIDAAGLHLLSDSVYTPDMENDIYETRRIPIRDLIQYLQDLGHGTYDPVLEEAVICAAGGIRPSDIGRIIDAAESAVAAVPTAVGE